MHEQTTTTLVLLTLITSTPAILLALARLIDTVRGNKLMADLDQRVNGRMDQLLKEREARARLEGFQEGQRARRRGDEPGQANEPKKD